MNTGSVFDDWHHHQYCYLTTVGRVSGQPHTIEIWFVVNDDCVWLFAESDGRTDWVRNLRREPKVTIRIGEMEVSANAEVVDVQPNAFVRQKLAERYRGNDDDLTEWASSALVVRVTPALN